MTRTDGPTTQAEFDRSFVEALEKDPVTMLKKLGVEPTPEIVTAIRALDFAALSKVAEAFSKHPAAIFP